MANLAAEIEAFLDGRERRSGTARMRAGLALACGIDLDEALCQTDAAMRRTILRVKRIMERERLKGARGHTGYDLGRHVGLKMSLDALRAASQVLPARKESGASRRRSMTRDG